MIRSLSVPLAALGLLSTASAQTAAIPLDTARVPLRLAARCGP